MSEPRTAKSTMSSRKALGRDLIAWARVVPIHVAARFDLSLSAGAVRHRHTNYEELIRVINESAATFEACAQAYWTIKRRVNALIAARRRGLEEAS